MDIVQRIMHGFLTSFKVRMDIVQCTYIAGGWSVLGYIEGCYSILQYDCK